MEKPPTHLTLTVTARLAVVAWLAPATALPQDDLARPMLFDSHDPIRVRIEAPLATLQRDRDEGKYLDGRFHYVEVNGAERSLDVKLRPRGRFRRQKDICDFPPVLLNFRKEQLKGTKLEGQDKLKLVTHCENDRPRYEQNLLQEYLAYRILNVLTDASFRVRLLHVDYLDTEKNGKTRTKYAFLIEDEVALSERLGMQAARVKEITYEQLDPAQTAFVTLFQYLIGNTDFSLVNGPSDTWCCHNAVLFVGPKGLFVPVPYDLDFAGLVDAPYAAPKTGLKIKTVKERQYLGPCSMNPFLDEPVARIAASRPAIETLVAEAEGLTKGVRAVTRVYLDSYYKDVADEKGIEKNLVDECS